MMKIVSSEQMAVIDSQSIQNYGLSSEQLMEQAGIKLAEYISNLAAKKNFTRLCIFTGSGHNGGDGLVIARRLCRRLNITLVYSGAGKSEVWQKNSNLCKKLNIPSVFFTNTNKESTAEISAITANTDCIIDCLTGTGLPGSVRQPVRELINIINSSHNTVVSVDIPSGLYHSFTAADSAVKADYTLYINLPKLSFFSELTRPFCGKLEIITIGFPAAVIDNSPFKASLLTAADIPEFYTAMRAEDYKNNKGHVTVFSGNYGTSGAAVLASLAASHSGCGLVSTFCSESVYPQIAQAVPSVMVKADSILSSSEALEAELTKTDAFCAGPGWGTTDKQSAMLETLIRMQLPGIIDADGIRLFARSFKSFEKYMDSGSAVCHIFTPHPGEFQTLYRAVFGCEAIKGPANLQQIQELADKLNSVIIYKACISIIALPGDKPCIVDGMFAPLAVAGAGDVLAGLCAGFLARGFKINNAAIAAVLIHLEAGKKLFAKSGLFNSRELADYIGRVTGLYET